jgi:hypothetical protein
MKKVFLLFWEGFAVMKISKGFELRNVADTYVIVPSGENLLDFSAMITINETGAYIWNLLLEDVDIDFVVDKMCSEFEVGKDVAYDDVVEFVNILKEKKVIE